MSVLDVVVELPELHPAQARVKREASRFNVLECGRRFGKTTFGVELTADVALAGLPVGWFAPKYKNLNEQWITAKRLLGPLLESSDRQLMQMRLVTGGVVDFWSLEDEDAGRGYKYKRIIVDEASLVVGLEYIWEQTLRATLNDYRGDAWFFGTPKGYGYFHKLFVKGQQPAGVWRSWRFTTADNPAISKDEIELARQDLPAAVFAQEYLGIPMDQTGLAVFEPAWLDQQRPHLREPLYRMDWTADGKLVKSATGRLAVYVEPDAQPAYLPAGAERVIRGCGIGMDVSEGVEASDSTIQVFFADNLEQAAELADNSITPSDLGRFAVAVASWYNDALICCVRKMHGLTAIRAMADECRYANIWHHHLADHVWEREAAALGWAKGESSDDLLFGQWRDALHHCQATLHSGAAWGQHREYIFDETGRIVHQHLAESNQQERQRHGDMVVACALARRACADLPLFKSIIQRQPNPREKYLRQQQEQAVRKGPFRRAI